MARKRKKKKRKMKRPRSTIALAAILECKGGPHKDRRDKRNRRDKLWEKDLIDNKE